MWTISRASLVHSPAAGAQAAGTAPVWHQVATHDVDEQAALLRGWNQSYAQLSSGRFEGRIEEVWLDGVHLFVEGTSQRLLQQGSLGRQRLAVGVPLRLPQETAQEPARFCGEADWHGEGEFGRFCTFSGPQGFEFFTPEGLVMAGIEVDQQELQRLAQADEEMLSLEDIGRCPALHPALRSHGQGLQAFMSGVFQMLAQHPSVLDDPAQRSQLRQAAQSNVLELLVSAQRARAHGSAAWQCTGDSGGAGGGAALLRRQQAWVAQARACLDADPQTPVTVASLCQSLGVSRRTLQSAFQAVLGMAPAAYLRATRLAGARRALHSAPTVTDAAAQWGFWHFGHFSQDYRRMFGELPSQTWRRLHA